MTATYASVDELLAFARQGLERLDPLEAQARVTAGAVIVDIRPAWQREVDGEIPGSLIVERNHLEWRLHPRSGANVPLAVEGQAWIVLCTEGYTSSLAAFSLTSLGLPASDIIGGIHAWRDAGLPVVAGPTGSSSVFCPSCDTSRSDCRGSMITQDCRDPARHGRHPCLPTVLTRRRRARRTA